MRELKGLGLRLPSVQGVPDDRSLTNICDIVN